MDGIKAAFAAAKREGRAALVTYVTCGYPTIGETPDVLLSLQKGGADVIELGMPFSDPIADGPTIQMSNNKALDQGVNIPACLKAVRDARSRGLKVPVLFMGYYNPVLSYGEERLLKDCQESGVNGFIMVDLPPEEAVRFRNQCRKFSLSYVPLIAPATSEGRMKLLCKIADSFIYVVSRMGVTGATGSLSAGLPDLVEKVHRFSGNIPAAVGFGVSTREHFVSVGSVSEGVVIGSQIINVLTQAPPGEGPAAVEKYVAEVTGREEGKFNRPNGNTGEENRPAALEAAEEPQGLNGDLPSVDKVVTDDMVPDGPGLADQLADPSKAGRIGEFGGQYVPESLMDCLRELEDGFTAAKNDPKFWEEFRSYYPYMGRPGHLQYSERLTQHAGGAKIWLKREDLNHTGSHKINNALGQILLARRLGKTEIICETGAGQHGVATATVCAKFGMKCTVYMGAEDVRRQALNVFRIKLLGAQVFAVEAGSRTLRDAVNEAMRAWVTKLSTTHYIIGSAIGPHPFPAIVREFQSVIGTETKEQMQKYRGKLPDAVVACVGGGSNAVGMFYPFSNDPSVKLLGVEAGGDGVDANGKAVASEANGQHGSQELRHSATLSGGTKGVLHGVHTYILQTPDGQVVDTYSISAGLDYPGVGPQLAAWKDDGRATYISASDAECLEGLKLLSQLEGIIPALETAHAVYGAIELAKTMDKEQDVVICLSGRGDKDVQTVAEELPRLGPKINWDLRF